MGKLARLNESPQTASAEQGTLLLAGFQQGLSECPPFEKTPEARANTVDGCEIHFAPRNETMELKP